MKQQMKTSGSSTIELTRKIGFGRNFWELETYSETAVTYTKRGRGDEDIITTFAELKTQHPDMTVEAKGKRATLTFQTPQQFVFVEVQKRTVPLSPRDEKRVKDLIGAIVDGFNAGTRYEDEIWEQKIKEFPKIVKCYTDDEGEFWVKDNEIWVREDVFREADKLLKYLLVGFEKIDRKAEYEPVAYLQSLEKVLPYLI